EASWLGSTLLLRDCRRRLAQGSPHAGKIGLPGLPVLRGGSARRCSCRAKLRCQLELRQGERESAAASKTLRSPTLSEGYGLLSSLTRRALWSSLLEFLSNLAACSTKHSHLAGHGQPGTADLPVATATGAAGSNPCKEPPHPFGYNW